jgi:hypothetical protein
MDSDERKALDDKQMLFTLLTAYLKKNGGEIRISEDEMDAVTKKDVVLLYYDKSSKEVILSLQFINKYGTQEQELSN